MSVRIDEQKVLEEIKKLQRDRKNITSLTGYYYSTLDIYNLMHIYKELTGEGLRISMARNPKYHRYMGKYMGMIDTDAYFYFLNQQEHTILSDSVLNTFEENNFIYYGRKDQMRLSEKEFFEIIKDFFGTYDERLYKLLNHALDRGLIDMRSETRYSATTHMRVTSDNHYILMPNCLNTEGLLMLSHELAHLDSHVVLDVRSKKQLVDTFTTYYESYSHYMEQCLLEYLKQNHILLKDTAVNENNYYSWMRGYFEELNVCQELRSGEEDVDVLMLISSAYQYSYGMLIGTLLHERYKMDSAGTKKDIDNFLFNQGLVDKDTELEQLGLSKEELKSPKVLAKRLQNHNEFYKKHS